MAIRQIKTAKRKVSRVLRDVDEGRFAIPKLQREFVWDGPKAAKLLDSIYRGMPVGVLLIWETPKSQRLYLRQRYHVLPPFDDGNSKVWFIIDGQQRISVLHHARQGDRLPNARGKEIRFDRVVLSLREEDDGQQIRYRKPIPGHLVSLSQVLHPQWRYRVGSLTKAKMRRVEECRIRLLKYVVYFMFVQMPIEGIRECFLRINTQGMKITTADAIFTQAEGLELRDVVHEVKQNLDGSFGLIPEEPILWAVATTQGATEARGRALQQVLRRVEKAASVDKGLRKKLAREWTRLGTCFGKAVDYLRLNFHVLNTDFLYSPYVVSMLALFFFYHGHGPSGRQKEEIRKWFWATAVGSRYSGRDFFRNVPADVAFFRRLAEGKTARFRFRSYVDKTDVRRTQYAGHSGIGTAFYTLLLGLSPVSILDEGLNPIPLDRYSTRANRKDRHHIFPRGPLSAEGIPPNRYNSICNICLLTAEENQTIGSRRPRSYLAEVAARRSLFARKMRRHLIPVGSAAGVWHRTAARGFKHFLKEREELICRALEKEAGLRLFQRERG